MECRHVRGFPVGTPPEAADLWDFCGAGDLQFKLFPDLQEHPDDAAGVPRRPRPGTRGASLNAASASLTNPPESAPEGRREDAAQEPVTAAGSQPRHGAGRTEGRLGARQS